jgi:hypothetical protein
MTKRILERRGWGVWRYRELLPDIEERKPTSIPKEAGSSAVATVKNATKIPAHPA